jgi:hypothetical protein
VLNASSRLGLPGVERGTKEIAVDLWLAGKNEACAVFRDM